MEGVEGSMTREEREEWAKMGVNFPEPLPEPAVYYGRNTGNYPETIRLSFSDGHTEIYDRRVKQPSPQAYLNIPRRRRRKP